MPFTAKRFIQFAATLTLLICGLSHSGEACAAPQEADADQPRGNIEQCQKHFSFISKGEVEAKHWPASDGDLDIWSEADKKYFFTALTNIEHKAPGFITRACNGKQIAFVISRHSNGTKLMETVSKGITCYPGALHELPSAREWGLVHEITHYLDANECLSDSAAWSRLIVPYTNHYSKTHAYEALSDGIEPKAAALGVPSGYAARNSSEALAEYTAAMIAGGWTPPAAIADFINNNLIKPTSTVDARRDLLRQSLTASEKSDWPTVIATCDKLLKRYPNDAVAYARRATAYYEKSEFQKSADDFTKSIALAPYTPEGYCGRGYVHTDLKQEHKAIEDFKKAIDIHPMTSNAYLGMGFAHDSLRQYQSAIQDYSRQIDLDPNNADAYFYRAADYRIIGKKSLAARDHAMATKLGYKD